MGAQAFQEAVESGDSAQIVARLARDVVFRSPIVYKPYDDRNTIAAILQTVAQVFEDFRYVERFDRSDAATLVFKARVGDRELDGVDILSFDEDGFVRELTVMVRPLSAAIALAEVMQERLAATGQQVV